MVRDPGYAVLHGSATTQIPLVTGSTETKSLPALSVEVLLLAEKLEMHLLEAFMSPLRYLNY